MRLLFIAGIICTGFWTTFSQTVQGEPQRFSYHIEGTVFDEQAQPAPKIFVCFVPAGRPIQGRIPCAKTYEDGKFSLDVKDIPDQYVITASTSENGFLVKDEKDRNYRFKSSGPLYFGAADESRKIDLQFDAPPAGTPPSGSKR